MHAKPAKLDSRSMYYKLIEICSAKITLNVSHLGVKAFKFECSALALDLKGILQNHPQRYEKLDSY